MYHHRPIKNFGISGNIYDEAHLPRLKNEYVWLVVSQMKTKGYVPRFDIDPDFTIQYNENKEIFEFELTVILLSVYFARIVMGLWETF